jgi:aerobic-type carbon monoxide dehydrogenase small subunit (CoxS/CutS family)
MPSVTMTVNGKKATGNVEPRTPLVQFLRENLALCRCGAYLQIIEVVTGCGAQAQGRFARLRGL